MLWCRPGEGSLDIARVYRSVVQDRNGGTSFEVSRVRDRARGQLFWAPPCSLLSLSAVALLPCCMIGARSLRRRRMAGIGMRFNDGLGSLCCGLLSLASLLVDLPLIILCFAQSNVMFAWALERILGCQVDFLEASLCFGGGSGAVSTHAHVRPASRLPVLSTTAFLCRLHAP